ncbi:unnamed protein product [Toxocara canis]|uniref:BRCT domain-containing protein n=1 Tax=Toxocara canis TaxID=6265 RepID=A0A3P7FIS7_TOXCA|nr:unnamed protein product [Toxocara canis]
MKDEKFYRFSNLTFFLDGESLPPTTLQYARILLKMHAAKISSSMDEHVTHFVVENRADESIKFPAIERKMELVDVAWIEAAVEL